MRFSSIPNISIELLQNSFKVNLFIHLLLICQKGIIYHGKVLNFVKCFLLHILKELHGFPLLFNGIVNQINF